MKNYSNICGDSPKVNTELEGCGNSIFVHKGRRNYGLTIPDGFCTARSEIDFGELGDRSALFLYLYYNFSFMPKSMKDCSVAQGASNATPNGAKSVSVSLPITSNPYGIPYFSDFIAEAQRRFEAEKDAKNEAYEFILTHGHYDAFVKFIYSNSHSGDAHSNCINHLISQS